MLISKLFRVATEGDSTDGREITRQQIDQMAKNYNPTKFGARIWLEHIRGILPDSLFRAFGDVVEVKADDVEIDGKKKRALFARLAPTPDLVAMNQARQKMYTSIEISPNFAKTGEAYLTGLAVTDSPASLGTEMLAFCAQAGNKNPLTGKKQSPENLFTAAQEVVIEFEESDAGGDVLEDGKSFFKRIMDTLKGDKKEFTGNISGVMESIEALAESQRALLDKFSALTGNAPDLKKFRDELEAVGARLKKTEDDFAAFRKQVEEAPVSSIKPRPVASGAGVVTTDC